MALISVKGAIAFLNRENRKAIERRQAGRCRRPNENVVVCEVGLNDVTRFQGRVVRSVLIFADNIPPFQTGSPFYIRCNADLIQCNITDVLAPDVAYALWYSPQEMSNREAVNLWVKLKPLAQYYLAGGGTSPPALR
ncbi:MAG: hypothetical protein AAF479_16430 [Pseudomonadota bacterium]